MTTFTLGADPEIFVKKRGVAVSAHGLVSGTKQAPLKTPTGAVQVDGMALEFNIDPTTSGDFEGFNRNIVRVMADLKAMVPGYSFNIAPVQEFSSEYLETLPAEALELGCDPDYNAYTLATNPRPDGTRNFRTGAGHVHIGWGSDIPVDNEDHIQICANFIKMLDATVGMYMTVIDRDPRRRELYGKAGAFRAKPYGVEYRTPSSLWITTRERRKVMHDLINKAIMWMRQGASTAAVTGLNEESIIAVINSGDHETALAVLKKNCYPYGDGHFSVVLAGLAKEQTKASKAA